MEKIKCAVCNEDMVIEHKIAFIDHYCIKDNHHFSIRIKDNKIAKMRVRFKDKAQRFCLKVHYDEEYSEVWSTVGSEKIKLDQVVTADFSDIEKLKNKIKTILVFA